MALPIMLANATVPLVGIVDTAVMGQIPDPAYIGAVALGATVFSTIFWLFGFLRMGTGGLVAQAFGGRQTTLVQQTLLRTIIMATTIGISLILLRDPIFWTATFFFDNTPKLQQLTLAYYTIRIFAAPATLLLYTIVGTLVGLQRMRLVLAVQLFLNCLNIALTLTFFHYFDWGISGVAAATLISEYLAAGLGLILVLKVQPLIPSIAWERSFWHWERWYRLLSVNFDLFIRTLCLIAVFYWLMAVSNRFGVAVLAANALLIQLQNFLAHVLDGFAHTAEALGGKAYGKRSTHEFLRYTRASAECAFATALVISVTYFVFGHFFIESMTSLPAVANLAQDYIIWIVLAPIISVWSFVLDGIFIGITWSREMRNGMLLSLVVFIVASVLLIPWIGNHGLWLSYMILMLCRAITLGIKLPAVVRQLQARQPYSTTL